MAMTCKHEWEHIAWCQECYFNGNEDYYHDQCKLCGEIA